MNMNAYVRYASFWRRLAATLLDSVLFGLVTFLILYLLYGGAYFEWVMAAGGVYYTPLEGFISNILPIIVTILFWMRLKATPGKLLLNCAVVNLKTGKALGFWRSVLRYFAYLASVLTLGLGFLWILWDAKRQGFHDKIAGTVVVMDDMADKTLAELSEDTL